MLTAASEIVPLTIGTILCEPSEVTRHVYFPSNGFISLVSITDGKSALEVGMVGREGMLGVQLVLGVPAAPLRALVQGSGLARRVSARSFRDAIDGSGSLRRTINLYVYVLMEQLAGAAACVRFHLIDRRLARWLLMTQDRAQADSFRVTHEFLAYMLGVRRVGVTAAAGELQRRGLIQYHRGNVTVLNRKGLEQAACSCYAKDVQAYNELL
jgi:CRP-like cAMP-binding protein